MASFAPDPRRSIAAVKVTEIVVQAFHDPLTVAVDQSPFTTKLNTGATFHKDSDCFILRSRNTDALGVYETIAPIDTSSGATSAECRRVRTIKSGRYSKSALVIDVTPSLILEHCSQAFAVRTTACKGRLNRKLTIEPDVSKADSVSGGKSAPFRKGATYPEPLRYKPTALVIDIAAAGRAEALNESAETHIAVRNHETTGLIYEPSFCLLVEHRRLSLREKGCPTEDWIDHQSASLVYVSE